MTTQQVKNSVIIIDSSSLLSKNGLNFIMDDYLNRKIQSKELVIYISYQTTDNLSKDKKGQKINKRLREIGAITLGKDYGYQHKDRFLRIRGIDQEQIEILSVQNSISSRTIIVTENIKLKHVAIFNSINVLSIDDLINKHPNLEAFTELQRGNREKVWKLIKNVLFFVAVCFALLNFIPDQVNLISEARAILNIIPGFYKIIIGIIGSLILGTVLFYFRENKRAIYGIVEIVFGIGSVTIVILQTSDYSKINTYIALFGGIYIIVRGWDNIYKHFEGHAIGMMLSNFIIRK